MKRGEEVEDFVKNLQEQIPSILEKLSRSVKTLSDEAGDRIGPVTAEDVALLGKILSCSLADFCSSFASEGVIVWDEWGQIDSILAIRIREANIDAGEKLLQLKDLLLDCCFEAYCQNSESIKT